MIEPAPPLTRVDVRPEHTLDDYAAVAHLAAAAGELKTEAASLVPRLAGRTIWHVNSTATGGGVAEILPPVVRLLRDLRSARNGWSSAAATPQPLLRPGDVLIVHDPQPLPLASFLRPAIPLVTVWRCHIGLDESNTA